jgi:regulation of enolase protein 1 (concanavalin A-like superfamily)
MIAAKETNLFNCPSGSFKFNNFPFYYKRYQGDFVVRCKITPEFKAMYDLGSIVVLENDNTWIKFAYENTDNGYPALVSVVTKDYSDDCNGVRVEGSMWLQVVRKGNVFALHFSEDKEKWSLARIFRLDMSNEVYVGISAQCPLGAGCKVIFESLEICKNVWPNIRNWV